MQFMFFFTNIVSLIWIVHLNPLFFIGELYFYVSLSKINSKYTKFVLQF